MTLEGHTILIDPTGWCKRKDLKAAGVSEHGSRPLHETVQAAHRAHELGPRPQVKVVRIAQHKRGVDICELFRCQSLDRRLCANRREDRRKQVAVRCSEDAGTSAVISGCQLEVKHRADYNGCDCRIEEWRLALGEVEEARPPPAIQTGKNQPNVKLARFMHRLSRMASVNRNRFADQQHNTTLSTSQTRISAVSSAKR